MVTWSTILNKLYEQNPERMTDTTMDDVREKRRTRLSSGAERVAPFKCGGTSRLKRRSTEKDQLHKHTQWTTCTLYRL